MSRTIYAAGAAVLRHSSEGLQVAVVHRGRHNDWTLPKGKVDDGEPLALTAVRECWEETGYRVRLTAPLGRWSYPVGKATKHVDWWRASLLCDDGAPVDTDEVDCVQWWSLSRAGRELTYAQEREVVALAAAQPETTPLIVLRHGKAVDRKSWREADADRPLAELGQQQARNLIEVLGAWGIQQVASSSWDRCRATVEPFARTHDLPVDGYDELSEEHAARHPDHVTNTMQSLCRSAASGNPVVVCGHRPVLPQMVDALDLPHHSLKPGEFMVAHITGDGAVHAVERFHHDTNGNWML